MFRWLGWMALLCALVSCGKTGDSPTANAPGATPEASNGERVELLFTYGSEKEEWVKAVTEEFHRGQPKIASGKPIHVTAAPKGSG